MPIFSKGLGEERSLSSYLEERVAIAHAQGVVMQRLGVDADTAGELLIRWARTAGTSVAESARAVLADVSDRQRRGV